MEKGSKPMKKLLTLALGLTTVAVVTSAALGGATPWLNRDRAGPQESRRDKNKPGGNATPWLNRDTPAGAGDYELTKDHLKIACRFSASVHKLTDGVPEGYHCSIPEGGWCNNNNPQRLKCQDMEFLFSWDGGGTAGLNRDNAG
jgi:hypothetical protein